jgi:hypothetical protein
MTTREHPLFRCLSFISSFDRGPVLGRRDHRCRSIRSSILERPILDKQDPSPSDIRRWGDGSISNCDDPLSFTKPPKLVGPLEPDTDIAARCRPLKHDNGIEAHLIRVNRGSTAIDLEPVRLNDNLEFSGAGIRAR